MLDVDLTRCRLVDGHRIVKPGAMVDVGSASQHLQHASRQSAVHSNKSEQSAVRSNKATVNSQRQPLAAARRQSAVSSDDSEQSASTQLQWSGSVSRQRQSAATTLKSPVSSPQRKLITCLNSCECIGVSNTFVNSLVSNALASATHLSRRLFVGCGLTLGDRWQTAHGLQQTE